MWQTRSRPACGCRQRQQGITQGDHRGDCSQARISGITLFDGDQVMKGDALNFASAFLEHAAKHEKFVKDEQAICARFGLDPAAGEVIRMRNS